MPLRRTIGVSLALLVVSTAAMGKTPATSVTGDEPIRAAKPGKSDPSMAHLRNACDAARSRWSHKNLTRHGSRARYQSTAGSSQATADTYINAARTVGPIETGKAAWYGLVGNYTSNGERLDLVTPTAAHRSLPLASYAKVTSLDSGRSVIVKINDRGPQSRRFIIDLSPRAADEIDMRRSGVAAVMVEPVIFDPATRPSPAATAFQGSTFHIAQ